MVTRLRDSLNVFSRLCCLVQMQPPERVAEDLVLYTLGLIRLAFNRNARTRRCENIQPICCAYLVNAEEVRGVADDHNALEAVGVGNDGEAMDRLIGAGALGFSDDVGLRNADALQIFGSNSAL